MSDLTKQQNICYCGEYGGGMHTRSARCPGGELRSPQGECPTGDYEQAGTREAKASASESPAPLLTSNERLLAKVRKAVEYADNGDPIKDAIDDDEIIDALRLLASSQVETTLHDPLRSFAEWAAGASCDDEYAPRMMRHLAALAKDALRGDAATPPPVIIGWAVGDLHGAPAMYNINERERAFDAAKRWDKPITGLIQAPGTPEFTQETTARQVFNHERDCGLTDDVGTCECPQKAKGDSI